MNNKALLLRTADPRLGPRPAARAAPLPPMSTPRAQVLKLTSDRLDGCRVLDLAQSIGLHPNTVRGHLDALVDNGLVERFRDSPSGRGRPAWCYRRAASAAAADGSEYADLASALADQLARTSTAPHDDAVQAGLRWGRTLATRADPTQVAAPETGPVSPINPAVQRPSETPGGTRNAGRRSVVRVLENLHFDPAVDAEVSTIRLCACPLLDAARAHPDIVCGVHLGLIQGVLESVGDTRTHAELIPFAEPGACLLRLSASAGQQ